MLEKEVSGNDLIISNDSDPDVLEYDSNYY